MSQDLSQQPLLSLAEINQLISDAVGAKINHKNKQNQAAFGAQESQLIGSGTDFADRQPYVRGDDPRHIDWRASARSSDTLIRRYHSELSTPCCIVIDRSSSMLFATQTRLKVTQAIRAGVSSAAHLLKTGQAIACLIIEQQPYWQPANSHLSAFIKTATHASRACPPNQTEHETDWASVSNRLKSQLSQGSHIIIISDFMSRLNQSETQKRALSFLSQYFHLSIIAISDRAEHSLTMQPLHLHHKGLKKKIDNKVSMLQINHLLDDYQKQLRQQLTDLKGQQIFIDCSDDLDKVNELFR